MQHFTMMVETDDGIMLTDAFTGDGNTAGVIVYMDIFGIRDELREVCRDITGRGYDVVLPNLFHRLSPSTFPPVRRRTDSMPEAAMEANKATTVAMTIADTEDLLDTLADESRITATTWGTIGYCMGGRHAIGAAATYTDRIKAAASVHGSRLVDDTPHSAMRMMRDVEGGLYFAFCREDHSCPPEDRDAIIAEFGRCKAEASHDIYDAAHGFACPGRWCSDADAAAIVLDKVDALFRRHLSD